MSDTTAQSEKAASSVTVPGPAALYQHDHPPIKNVNEIHGDNLRLGQRVADKVASVVGGWPFIIFQSMLLILWMAANVYLALHYKDKAFDPYPFILLNLVLSFQAAYTGPIVMMSQNRQNEKDRLSAQSDYECNLKAEEEIRVVMDHLVHQDQILVQQDQILADITARLEQQDQILNDITGRLEQQDRILSEILARSEWFGKLTTLPELGDDLLDGNPSFKDVEPT
jgi:uncharacterized membrane protein